MDTPGKYKNIGRLETSILSVDVGAFTQDILFWGGTYESAFKMILPSPTQIMAQRVTDATRRRNHIVVHGETMGGGLFNRAVKAHLSRGLGVNMTVRAARTVRDDLEYVQGLGVDLVDDEDVVDLIAREDVTGIEIKDVDAEAIRSAASNFGLKVEPEAVAIGVEDHGTPIEPGESTDGSIINTDPKPVFTGTQTDREIRFEHFKDLIPSTSDGFGFSTPPDHYTRMAGVKRTLDHGFPDSKHLIMDSKIAAVFGSASSVDLDHVVAADVGNGHTTVASIDGDRIVGIFEHHTGSLDREKVMRFINDFTAGTLTNEDIFGDGGHGCYVAKAIPNGHLVVTGPKRDTLFTEAPPTVIFTNPHGDNMITGNVGLTECARQKFGI
jgi:uncharacterized protein (DUF1786 family)